MRQRGRGKVNESKYIMPQARGAALPAIRKLLPGRESPTIIPLEGTPERVVVHAVCRENVFWETLESLKKAGASAILVFFGVLLLVFFVAGRARGKPQNPLARLLFLVSAVVPLVVGLVVPAFQPLWASLQGPPGM